MKELNNLDPMPFGKFKGKPLQDVPASYLWWLWNEGVKHNPEHLLHHYIKKSIKALKEEYPDGIW